MIGGTENPARISSPRAPVKKWILKSGAVLVRCRADDERGKPTDVGTLCENNSSVCKLSSLTNASVPFSTSPTPLRATSHRRPTPITGYKQRDDLSRVLCLCVHKVTRVKQSIVATNIQQPVGNFTGIGDQPIPARDAVTWTCGQLDKSKLTEVIRQKCQEGFIIFC